MGNWNDTLPPPLTRSPDVDHVTSVLANRKIAVVKAVQNPERRVVVSVYRCYFLDNHDRIRASEDFDADVLPDAIERAQAMLKKRAHYHAIEVWQGCRRLYVTYGLMQQPLPHHRG